MLDWHMLDWHSCQICYPFETKILLLLILLLQKIDEKIYESIKSIYTNTSACVRLNGN